MSTTLQTSTQTTEQSSVTLSDTAAREIKDIMAQQELPADRTLLRVGVKGGGCSGFTYMLDLTEDPAGENDETMVSQGITLVCDNRSLLYLDGTQIDFRDEVMGRGFVFKNPNATSTCGCGSSFQA